MVFLEIKYLIAKRWKNHWLRLWIVYTPNNQLTTIWTLKIRWNIVESKLTNKSNLSSKKFGQLKGPDVSFLSLTSACLYIVHHLVIRSISWVFDRFCLNSQCTLIALLWDHLPGEREREGVSEWVSERVTLAHLKLSECQSVFYVRSCREIPKNFSTPCPEITSKNSKSDLWHLYYKYSKTGPERLRRLRKICVIAGFGRRGLYLSWDSNSKILGGVIMCQYGSCLNIAWAFNREGCAGWAYNGAPTQRWVVLDESAKTRDYRQVHANALNYLLAIRTSFQHFLHGDKSPLFQNMTF